MKKAVRNESVPTAAKSPQPASVDAYLAAVPVPARSALNELRATIRSAAPAEAAEGISYGMPAFRYKGALVWYAAFRGHCSFFPGSAALLASFQDDLNGFTTSKGTIRFTVENPLPKALVVKLVKARVAENEARARRKTDSTNRPPAHSRQ